MKPVAARLQDRDGTHSGMNENLLLYRMPWPRLRALYLPSSPARKSGLDLFVPEWANRSLIGLAARVRPATGRLPEDHLCRVTALAAEAGATVAGVLVGTPGPYQKISVALHLPDGRLVVAKLALGSRAEERIAIEAQWLRRLAETAALAKQVPRLLAEGQIRGRAFLVQTVRAGPRPPRRWIHPAAAFLWALAGSGPREGYLESAGWRGLETGLKRLRPHLDSVSCGLLGRGIEAAGTRLVGMALPATPVHRDFAPWNAVLEANQLFVFDWEYAIESGNPVQDFLHWHLLSAVVRGRLPNPSTRKHVLAGMADYLAGLSPSRNFPRTVLRGLLIAYLLDVLLFYAEADGGLRLESPVINGFLTLLRQEVVG